jgi:hypothetical protein
VIALTSFSPAPERVAVQAMCLASWRTAGLTVRSLNAHAEIAEVRKHYAADFVAVPAPVMFGRALISLDTILAEVKQLGEPVLLINADLELAMSAAQLARFEIATRAGLGYFMQYNHDGDRNTGTIETQGLAAFLLRPEHADLVGTSSLRYGEPWWDYWLPWALLHQDRCLYAPPQPMGYHLRHGGRWSEECWYRCAAEFARVAGLPCVDDDDPSACSEMSRDVLETIQEHTTTVDVDA